MTAHNNSQTQFALFTILAKFDHLLHDNIVKFFTRDSVITGLEKMCTTHYCSQKDFIGIYYLKAPSPEWEIAIDKT